MNCCIDALLDIYDFIMNFTRSICDILWFSRHAISYYTNKQMIYLNIRNDTLAYLFSWLCCVNAWPGARTQHKK